MKITAMGIDLAKEVFQIHGVDARGKAVVRKRVKRNEMVKYLANLGPCLIGMEACDNAHHWGRKQSAKQWADRICGLWRSRRFSRYIVRDKDL